MAEGIYYWIDIESPYGVSDVVRTNKYYKYRECLDDFKCLVRAFVIMKLPIKIKLCFYGAYIGTSVICEEEVIP